jgi:hypothetical protein
MSSTAMALAAPATLNVCQPKLNFFRSSAAAGYAASGTSGVRLPVGPQLRVLQQEVLDRLVELGLESLELVDQLRGVLPRHEVGVGRGERLRVLGELVAGLLLDLLKDLAALVRIDQLLRAERGDRLAFDFVR